MGQVPFFLVDNILLLCYLSGLLELVDVPELSELSELWLRFLDFPDPYNMIQWYIKGLINDARSSYW